MKTLLVIFCLVFVSNGYAQTTKVQSKYKISLRNVQGEDVALDTLLGEGPLLLSFWASWCEPCKSELKAFQLLSNKHSARGLRVVAINIDKVRSLSKVKSYVTTQGFTFPVLLDPDGSLARDLFSVETLPNSFLLKPDGAIAKRFGEYHTGFEAEVEEALGTLLPAK
jgi:cytochrome c biogenesis protein CcmG, thiol:disulfide interchange protein DsbE